MKRKLSLLKTGIILLAVGVGVFLTNYLFQFKAYKEAMATMTYQHMDASGVPDGTYIGECDVYFIYAKVAVTVQDGQILSITLLTHRHDRGEAATGIEQQIVAQQRIDVEAVAGATNSCKVIKKAVDNALSSAITGGIQ